MAIDLLGELINFGLTYKESKLYLALLETGTTLASDLAKKSHLNRSTTYVLLESLVSKGLAGISEQHKIKYYSPAPPERIVQYLQDNAQKYAELVGTAHNIMPELKSMYVGVGPKPKIQFFEGVEGIKTAYEDTLTSKENILAFASIESSHKTLGDFYPAYYNRRADKNIKIQAIFPDTIEARERMKHNKNELREAYLVPKEKYSFSPEINIYENKIVFVSFVEKFALVIESAELTDAMKKVFDLSWEQAKILNKKNGH